MRFTSAAVSATVVGFAMALPGVVYETSVVTITSCGPEKTSCPGRTSTSTYIPVYTPPPPPPTTTPCPSTGYSITYSQKPNVTYVAPTPSVKCPGYPNCPPANTPTYTSTPVCPGAPNCPPVYTSTPVCPGAPHCPYPTTKLPVYSTTYPYVPSGTGYPVPPKNTSVPVVPTSPPAYTGAASIQGFSLLAAGVAVAAFFL